MSAADSVVKRKLSRIAKGAKPRVLDLFAGCGGLSLGFEAAGFEPSGAIEFDPHAAASYGSNFHPKEPVHAIARDITTVSPEELSGELGWSDPSEQIDVIVGGPPCQAFARVGRPKLREIAEHPRAFKHDPRAKLYLHYLEYVNACEPLALLIENVPDVLNHGGQNIAEDICEVLEGRDYIVRYTLLNAAFFGVPQMRERMFLIAYHRLVANQVSFPAPSHWLELPPGYHGSRQVALKPMNGGFFENSHYVAPLDADARLPSAITAEEAIGDLPPITEHLKGNLRRGARRFSDLLPYEENRTPSDFARRMREWPGHANTQGVSDHVIRYLPRDWKLFARMANGDQYPEAHAHAVRMFQQALKRLERRGTPLREGTAAYRALKASIVPPYDTGKFPNKWRKMWRDQPARTLMAHLGKDSYSHIHYDTNQARTISVREAARLQSFPDGFLFSGTMNPAFRQIGNAVPPVLAKSIAETMVRAIRNASIRQSDGSGNQPMRLKAVL